GGGKCRRVDASLQCGICYRHHEVIRDRAIRLDHDRTAFALGGVECRAELLESHFLVAQINRWIRASGDADDLLVRLRPKSKTGERNAYRDPGLENEVGAEQEEKNEEKNHIQHRKDKEPAEADPGGPGKLH